MRMSRPKCRACAWRYRQVECHDCGLWLCFKCYGKHVPDIGPRRCALPPRHPVRWGIERTAPRPATCFWCEKPFALDVVAFALSCGDETIAVMCPGCVCPNGRRQLADAAARARRERVS